jgi:hypothetical protein
LHKISNDNGVGVVKYDDHYLMVARVKERLEVNKQRSQRFHMERIKLKKLNMVKGKEQ